MNPAPHSASNRWGNKLWSVMASFFCSKDSAYIVCNTCLLTLLHFLKNKNLFMLHEILIHQTFHCKDLEDYANVMLVFSFFLQYLPIKNTYLASYINTGIQICNTFYCTLQEGHVVSSWHACRVMWLSCVSLHTYRRILCHSLSDG